MNPSVLRNYTNLEKPSLIEYLKSSSFDELIEINIAENTFRFVYNDDEKYIVPMTNGAYDEFYKYVARSSVYPDDSQLYLDTMNPTTMPARLERAETPGAIDISFRIRRPEGGWKWVEQLLVGTARQGVPDGTVYCYIFDIQRIKDREMGLTFIGDRPFAHDKLTGLFTEKDFFAVAQALMNDGRTYKMIALDLENFKIFNDWYGREAGDKVLTSLGAYFEECASRTGGVGGYFGQDDFCLLFPEQSLSVQEIYERIHKAIMSHGMSFGFLPLIGVAVSEKDVSVLDLYDRASLACHHAKGDFKRRICTFDPSLYRQTEEDLRILSEFREALDNEEITFFLQPQCRASTKKIVGAESLARWRKKDGSFVPPAVFIPPLEKHGFIADLDMYIWDKVCAWLKETIDKGLPLIPVSVNVSQVDIFSMNVPEYVSDLVDRYGLPHKALKIEITESACGEDSGKVRETIAELRSRGFTVLMDDFGSGYSSLNVLHEMSFDVIKLDAKFLHTNKASADKGMHILESVVNMAKTLGTPIIVEGVEAADQVEYLTGLGCRYIQGYYFYRPMPISDFEALISDRKNVDTGGFIAKSNDQFKVREFLNDDVYSDSMLNNILGPVAIYVWHGEDVDIVRYNQQFYESVSVKDFSDLLLGIQKVMPQKDKDDMFALLQKAMVDRLNGAEGLLTFYRTEGGASHFLMHFYFLDEIDGRKRFYGCARDVTEITNLSNHMRILERYFSDTIFFLMRQSSGFRFQIAAHGLENVLNMSVEDLQKELNSGEFFLRVIEEEQPTLNQLTHRALAQSIPFSTQVHFRAPDGQVRLLFLKCDIVDDITNDVRIIISLSQNRSSES